MSIIKINRKRTARSSSVSSRFEQGFTIIELLIVMGIIGVLAAAASPIYGNLQVSSQLNEASRQIAQDLRLAQQQSRAGKNGMAHGVKFTANGYTLFQGASYALRDSAYDRINNFSKALTLTTTLSGDEIVFSTGAGKPDVFGTVTATHSVNGTRIITLNSNGAATE